MNKDEAAKLNAIFRNDKPKSPRPRANVVAPIVEEGPYGLHIPDQLSLAGLSLVDNLVHRDFRLFKPLKEIDEPKTEVKSDLKPEWVSRLSTEFKAEISEVENFKKPQQKEIPVSPLMAERRNNSKGNQSV